MSNLNCAVICIARLEGNYIREFVEHYLALGFSKIIIADNNHDGEDDLDVIDDYVKNGQVIIEDYHNIEKAQMKAYTELYLKYGNKFDWLLFCDIDEFLVLEKHKTIQEFLADKNDYECVLINWKTYGDSGQIYADYSKPIMERFTVPCPNAKSQYSFEDDYHVKSIVKGGLPKVIWYSNPHTVTNPLLCCNAKGERCDQTPFQRPDHTVAHFNHYTTKSLEEYCENKTRRGAGDRSYDCFKSTYKGRYFRINEMTKEKLKWIKEHGYDWI